MNYTPNLHLPQWEMSDRVLMDDFNHAMARLDGGIAEEARLITLAQNLSRDAYRLAAQQRVHHGYGGHTEAIWLNALASREDAGDLHGWTGHYGVRQGGGYATAEAITASAHELDYICYPGTDSYRSCKAALMFTSDGPGFMESIKIFFYDHHGYKNQVPFPYVITMTRMDTGEIVKQTETLTAEFSKVPAVPLGLPLETGVTYRLDFALPDNYQYFTGWAGFLLDSGYLNSSDPNKFVLREPELENTFVRAVDMPENARSALGLVRWEGKGTVSLEVNGAALPLVATRENRNAEGRACLESEFRLDSLPDGPLSLTARMTPDGGMLTLYDYGLIWQ